MKNSLRITNCKAGQEKNLLYTNAVDAGNLQKAYENLTSDSFTSNIIFNEHESVHSSGLSSNQTPSANPTDPHEGARKLMRYLFTHLRGYD